MAKDFPEPIRIPRRAETPTPQTTELMLPLALADGPRIFLNFLALHSTIPLVYREKIADWLLQYRTHLVAFLVQNYGVPGVLAADAIAKDMAEQFLSVVKEDYDKAEGDLFDRLEDELKDNGALPQ